jgi:hypothetical protein
MNPDSTERWQRARRVLCVRLDQLGDVLMTTPAIRALKESGPGRRITLLTSPGGAAVARLVPEVDEVLVYASPWMKATAPREDPGPDFEMIERVRAGSFDAAAIFTVYSQNPLPAAMLCYLAGIPLRLAHCRENPYQLLTDWVGETEPESGIRHEVRRQLDLVESVGARTSDDRLSLRPTGEAISGKPGKRVGTWIARPAADTTITLVFQPRGLIVWKVSQPGRDREFAGFAIYEQKILTLSQDQDNSLVGLVHWQDEDHFTFKVLASRPGDPGLTIAKSL